MEESKIFIHFCTATIISLILITSLYQKCLAQQQQFTYPDFLGKSAQTIRANSDWRLLTATIGDLNNDHKVDKAWILESKDSIMEKCCSNCGIQSNKGRIIVVLLNDGKQSRAFVQNNLFIARSDEGGMANYIEPELSIKNGLLSIYYQYTRSNTTYTFKYSDEDMVLTKAKTVGVSAGSGVFESDEFNFEKMEIVSERGHISQEHGNTETIPIQVSPKNLSEFKSMYEWKIAENKYL